MSVSVKEEARSVSPLCPKLNECEEPEGAAMEVSSAVQGQPEEGLITKEMAEMERNLKEEGEREESEIMEKVSVMLQHGLKEERMNLVKNIRKPQGSLHIFESWFDINTITSNVETLVTTEREQNILSMLHQILTPFLLRRLKSDVTLEVPPKKEIVVYAPMTSKQDAFYRAIVNKTIAKVLGQEKRKTKEEIYGCGEGRHEGRWSKRRRCRGQGEMEADDLLWRPLKGIAKRKSV